MISFTTEVKNEVSKIKSSKFEQIAELTTIISLSEINETIKITTENYSVARRIFQLIKDISDIIPMVTVRKGVNYQNKNLFIIEIKDIKKLSSYIEINKNTINQFIIDDLEAKSAFLRAMFMMNSSINDPKKSRYHLEFIIHDYNYALFLSDILNEYSLNSKVIKRDLKYMVYIKESEKISDFLRVIKAYNAVLYYEDIRIYRDYKNMTNRLNNCEQANVDKIIATSHEQITQIELIEEKIGLDILGENVKEVALYRLKYPEISLLELSEIISLETGVKITKSGLYHRFKKIKELYEKIK